MFHINYTISIFQHTPFAPNHLTLPTIAITYIVYSYKCSYMKNIVCVNFILNF
uniref:Uncharacterized protein n=1 Tax=Solanum lycopersicum TaxID=4081 RepID=A0A3Q7HJV5_SOLLC